MVKTTKKQKLLLFAGTTVAAGILVFVCINLPGSTEIAQPEKSPSDSPVSSQQQTPTETTAFSTPLIPTQSEEQTQQPTRAGTQHAIVNKETKTFQTESGATYPLRTYKPLLVNDPAGQQWWTSSTGMDTAWSIGPGAKETVVAVIDTGFALQHEEFTDRWAHNSSEQGATNNQAESRLNCTSRGLPISQSCNLIDDNFDGTVDNEVGTATIQNPSQLNCTDAGLPLDKACNAIDDEGNGYVDDVTGWDFIYFDASVQAGQINPDGNTTHHGTAVSGVLAATGNNDKGIAGVDWKTKILPLQAIDDDSYGNTLTVARAIYYAANRGVDVINLSLGSDSEDSYLRQAIQYALDKNVIVVAASGNDGCDCISYPARYPEVVAVGAQNESGNPASFSSYGTELDILAPGEGFTTPSWSKTLPSTAYADNVAGTSFSAPYVSGLLSLARSHQPNATWSELLNGLLATANHSSLTTSNPFTNQLGSGYAKADTFMTRLTTPDKPIIRYTFWPTPAKSTLSSGLSYQCMFGNDFPTAPFYEITRGSSTFYTVDPLERVRATARGDSVYYLGRTCVGLPNDQPSTMRYINLLSEIKNIETTTMW